MSLKNKIESAINTIKRYEQMALTYQPFGYHVAFSGGKDSQVIKELCNMAGVKYTAFFYKTSVDPKELLTFIRSNYPDVVWVKPKETMFQLILKKGMLPTRKARYCCEVLKERNGLNAVVITGLTKAESAKRRKRNLFETSCVSGMDKILLNPIIDWTANDVFNFLQKRNIDICPLYKTQYRIGCVGCPLHPKSMRKDFARLPNFKQAYVNTTQKLMDKGKYKDFETASDVVDWWSSGISANKWRALKKQQYKIDY